MPRTSPALRLRRLTTAGCVLLSLAALSACAAATSLTFDRGESLNSDVTVGWKDGLADDDGWSADGDAGESEGNGGWSYTNDDGCTVILSWGSTVGIFDDDLGDLDATNKYFTLMGDSEILDGITTGTFRLEGDTPGTVEMRQVRVADDLGARVFAARFFIEAEAGTLMNITCENPDDLDRVLAEVIEKNPVIVTTGKE